MTEPDYVGAVLAKTSGKARFASLRPRKWAMGNATAQRRDREASV